MTSLQNAMKQKGSFQRSYPFSIVISYILNSVLENPADAHMQFNGQDMIMRSVNNYLGLARHPYIRQAALEAVETWDGSPDGGKDDGCQHSQLSIVRKQIGKILSKAGCFFIFLRLFRWC